MSLIKRYMVSQGNISSILEKIRDGVPPEKFNVEHLKGLGFTSSNDRAIVPLLKDLGFLTSEGKPTQRYHDYRDKSRSKIVLGEAILDAYGDLFQINENLSASDRPAIEGKFKTAHASSDNTASLQAATFLTLLANADLKGARKADNDVKPKAAEQEAQPELEVEGPGKLLGKVKPEFYYNIQVHLPATKDIDVYHAIFKSIRENLLDV